MNRFSSSFHSVHGLFEYEAVWSTVARKLLWDSEVRKGGRLVARFGGEIDNAGEIDNPRELVEAQIRHAISTELSL